MPKIKLSEEEVCQLLFGVVVSMKHYLLILS